MNANITLTREINNLATVKKFSFITKEGKPLEVTGELAQNLSVYYGMTAMGNKATFETAHRLRNIMNMETEDLKNKYSVDSGKKFITKYMGLADGTISNYKKVADWFFKPDSSEVRDEIFSVYNFAQLQELSVYIVKYMDKRHGDFAEAYSALCETAPTEYPYTMSSAKMRSAIKAEFETVEEKTAREAKKTAKKTESNAVTGETVSSGETSPVISYEDLMNSAKTAKVRCERILETMFNESGEYIGDEITQHFKATCEFIIGLFTIDKPETESETAPETAPETETA